MPYDPSTMTQRNVDEGSEELEAQLAFVERSVGVHYGSREPRHKHHHFFSFERIATFGIPVIIGIIFGFCVWASGKSTIDNNNNTSVPLAEPPKNFNTVCLDGGNVTQCQEICKPAECCHFPASTALSCLAGNEETCFAYHQHCSLFDPLPTDSQSTPVSQEVQPAPPNLKSICSVEGLSSVEGFAECEEACRLASCCFTSPRCQNAAETCKQYAPCLHVHAFSFVHQDIPLYIEQKCNSTNLLSAAGRSECYKACSPSVPCCSRTGDCTPESETDESICSQYDRCNLLDQELKVVATKSEIQENCALAPFQKGLCKLVCERGQCCFSSNGCQDVFPDNDCSIYKPCKGIFDDSPPVKTSTTTTASLPASTGVGSNAQGEVIILKEDVDEACISFDPGAENSDEAPCAKLCANVGCCFDKNGCSDSTINCHKFQECDVIYDDDDGDDEEQANSSSPSAVVEACEIEVVAIPGQKTACEQLCQPAKCCFESGSTTTQCEGSNNITCSEYAVCSKIYNKKQQQQDEMTVLGNKIFEACDANVDIQLCESLCDAGRCCFPSNNCNVPADVSCMDYVACEKQLFNNKSENGNDENKIETIQPPDTTGRTDSNEQEVTVLGNKIFDACDANVDIQLCESLCDAGRCCFPSNNCNVPAGVSCMDYVACEKQLFNKNDNKSGSNDDEKIETIQPPNESTSASASGTTGNEAADHMLKDDVDRACLGQEKDDTVCEVLCDAGKCCFDSESCEAPADIDCLDFVGCEHLFKNKGRSTDTSGSTSTLHEDEIAQMTSSLFHSIETACQDKNEQDLCETLCESGKCCYDKTNGECDDQVNCDDFRPCEPLYVVQDLNSAAMSVSGTNVGVPETTTTTTSSSSVAAATVRTGDDYTWEDIRAACEGNDAVTSMCSKICEPAKCCFVTSHTCTVDCEVYEHCQRLYNK